MRKYLIRNRRKIGIIFIIAFFFIMFPYTVTMINFGKTRGVVYEPETYGKSVVIKNNNKTMEIDVEMFVPLVVYSMMPVKYEKEALKAQMVIIRTFIQYKMGDNNSIDADELTLPYTTYSELEKKWGKKYEKNYNYTMKLLVETNRETIYYDGKNICPYYHELSAGVTNTGEEPYLKSVDSSADKENKNFNKIAYFTMDEIREKLKNIINPDISDEDLSGSIKVNYEENGEYVRTVSIGDNIILAKDWSEIFNLPSYAFAVENFSGGFKMSSKGIGDGKGLSVNGALKMAEDGKEYRDILKYYYSDIEIR